MSRIRDKSRSPDRKQDSTKAKLGSICRTLFNDVPTEETDFSRFHLHSSSPADKPICNQKDNNSSLSEHESFCTKDERDILEMSKEIDEKLEAKADAHNLSALNVKSILHHLINNEHVLNMLKNTILEQNGNGKSPDAEYQPKLTRKKAKELAEKGTIVWPLTPSKAGTSAAPSILDVEFDDDEDDEDYEPVAETSSVAASQCSSSLITLVDDDEDMEDGSEREDNQTLVAASDTTEEETSVQGSSVYETRSKVSLVDVSLMQLEAQLFAAKPDFSVDIFNNLSDQDPDYFNFLNTLTTNDLERENGKDDEDGDPEYNFMDDADNDDSNDELRLDRATKISKKEVQDLLQDLCDIFADESDEIASQSAPVCISNSPLKTPEPVADVTLNAENINGFSDQQAEFFDLASEQPSTSFCRPKSSPISKAVVLKRITASPRFSPIKQTSLFKKSPKKRSVEFLRDLNRRRQESEKKKTLLLNVPKPRPIQSASAHFAEEILSDRPLNSTVINEEDILDNSCNSQPSEESARAKRKRSKAQKEHDALRAALLNVETGLIERILAETIASLLKSSLFMHQSKIQEIYALIDGDDAETNRAKIVCQLMDVLQTGPSVQPLLLQLLLLFLTSEEALLLNCYERHRNLSQGFEILIKLYKYHSFTKGAFRLPAKLLQDIDNAEDAETWFISLCNTFGSDSRPKELASCLFPNLPFDGVCCDEMETVHSDDLQFGDEFETVNLTSACGSDSSLFGPCICECHRREDNAAASCHCQKCSIKFLGEYAYVWRGNRLTRAQFELYSFDDDNAKDSSSNESPDVSPLRMVADDFEIETNGPWKQAFEAVDHLDQGTLSSSSLLLNHKNATCGSQMHRIGDDSNSTQDLLKRAVLETFGTFNFKVATPAKRAWRSMSNNAETNDDNSSSLVFVRGADGANTMLPTQTHSLSNAEALVWEELKTKTNNSSVSAVNFGSSDDENWTEEEDRYLLEQFQRDKNCEILCNMAALKLQKTKETVKLRLNLLLQLLEECS